MNDLPLLVKQLLQNARECEWLEFKDSYYEPNVLGEYLSALANAACLESREKGYLIFGVDNQSLQVVGTSFRPALKKQGNQPLEFWLNQMLIPRTGFDIHEFEYYGKRIVMFAVNAAKGEPVRFNGEAYIRIESCKTKLKHHPNHQRRIWLTGAPDWSAAKPAGATLEHLEPEALLKAREQYKIKHQSSRFVSEIDKWDEVTFLNKTRLAIEGKLTYAAIVLLGKPESVHFISPSVARITWILRDRDGIEIDYAHYDPPFLLNVDRLFAKIRNLTIRELPDGTLFPVEITQYDPWVLREALHNCIAHQDYRMCSRILVIDRPDSLLFSNAGTFLPGSVEAVLEQDAPQRFYPNRLLTEAMVNLNMIDTIGSGIKRMFSIQRKRYMPMPEYDLSSPEEVKVTMPGRILDENYTKILIKEVDIPLEWVIMLDKIQKGHSIPKEGHNRLKKAGLVEGRYPNLFVSEKIARVTGNKVEYIKHRAFDKQYYKDLIIEFLKEHPRSKPEEIHRLLADKLSDLLNKKQKRNKIRNLLQEMSRDGKIRNTGTRGQGARWERIS